MAIATDKLREWINGDQDYKAGVMLYITYGRINQLKEIFKNNPIPTDLIRRKLLSELTRIYQGEKKQTPPVKKSQIKVVPVAVPGNDEAKEFIEDEIFTSEKQRILLLFKEQSDLHSKLDATEREDDRRELCLQILKLDKQVSSGWDNLDYYKEHGCFKPVSVKPELTPVELVKRRNTLRSYVSREKNEEKLAAFKLELEQVEEALAE